MSYLCSYGCGRKGKYKFKNGKFCCSSHIQKCPENNRKRLISRKGYKHSIETIKKISESNKGRVSPMFGKKHSEETKIKMRENQLGQNNSMYGRKYTDKELEVRRRVIKDFMESEKGIKYRKELRFKMLNGRAAWMNKFIKNPSKQEIKLRNIVRELYPSCEFQYKVFNYALDIAIPEYKIAIEYDGYYHFDTEEHIGYHKKRRHEIENDGWKFIKYTIFDKFPSKYIIENDICNIIGT